MCIISIIICFSFPFKLFFNCLCIIFKSGRARWCKGLGSTQKMNISIKKAHSATTVVGLFNLIQGVLRVTLPCK